ADLGGGGEGLGCAHGCLLRCTARDAKQSRTRATAWLWVYTDFIVHHREQSAAAETTFHCTDMTADRSAGLWSHVHLLTVIAQTGSFTQAAQRLNLSKAAVSQRVSELERAVGTTLVQRTTRSLRLTDAGQRLVDDTAESFAHIARSVGDVRD